MQKPIHNRMQGAGSRTMRGAAPGALAVALLLAGCTVGPKYHPPAPLAQAPPPAYKEQPAAPATSSTSTSSTSTTGAAPATATKEWTIAQPQDAMLRGKWWEIYNDPELNALEDKLEIDNQNIKLYFQNFMIARALVREARALYYPTISTGPSWSRARSSANIGNRNNSNNTGVINSGATNSTASLPLDITWEPDLFGRIRNTVHEEQYAAQVSAADLENERLTEQASLAQFFFELRGQDALQEVLNNTVEADKRSLALTEARFETGVDDQLAVTEAQTTLLSAQSAATNVGILRAQYQHAIALLIGESASDFSIPVKAMIPAPPPIPIGIPSQLLERRPDIAAAERNIASANAAIGVAYAAFYPAITLSATGGFQSSSFKHLFDWPSRVWSLGPSVSQTLFSAQLGPGVSQFVSTYNASVASYRQTVLTAFQQVEDYLSATRILSHQIQQQQEAVTSAQKALDLELGRYETGIDPYINVVTLQTTLLGNQQTLTNLQIQEISSSVQLIEALGGGWDRTQLPTPKQVTQTPDRAQTKMMQ